MHGQGKSKTSLQCVNQPICFTEKVIYIVLNGLQKSFEKLSSRSHSFSSKSDTKGENLQTYMVYAQLDLNSNKRNFSFYKEIYYIIS